MNFVTFWLVNYWESSYAWPASVLCSKCEYILYIENTHYEEK